MMAQRDAWGLRGVGGKKVQREFELGVWKVQGMGKALTKWKLGVVEFQCMHGAVRKKIGVRNV